MAPTMNESQEPDDLEQVIERLLRDPVHGPRLKKRLRELGLSPRAYVLDLCRRDVAGAVEMAVMRSIAKARLKGS